MIRHFCAIVHHEHEAYLKKNISDFAFNLFFFVVLVSLFVVVVFKFLLELGFSLFSQLIRVLLCYNNASDSFDS